MRILRTLALCALPLLASAQPPAEPPPRIATALASGYGIDDLLIQSGKKSLPVSIPTSSRSLPIPLGAATELVFFRERIVDDKVVHVPAVTVPIPPEIKQPLLLFIPDRSATPGFDASQVNYRVKVIEDSVTVFPASSVNFFNATPGELAVRVNKSDAKLPSGANLIIPFTPDTYGDIRVRIARFDGQRDAWRHVMNAPFSAPGGQRLLIFAAEDSARTGAIMPIVISEALPPPPAP